jgi:hypothetical protein
MKPIFAVAIAAALFTTLIFTTIPANAQDTSKQSGAAPPESEPYTPGLGEIMALQQMRHIKIWFAGHAGNWPLADYEIGELKEGFDDVSKLLGGDIVDKHIGAPVSALEKAIDGKDRAAFTVAFDALSAGCNGCHHTLDHGFIVIGRPSLLPYSNQLFAPQK